MLDEIRAALLTVDPNVCYGTDQELDGTDIWDYTVFRRVNTVLHARQKYDLTDCYEVSIVRQDYVPEDEPLRVLAALEAVPGLKRLGEDIRYTAVTKPGTKAQLEIATLTVCAPRKAGTG